MEKLELWKSLMWMMLLPSIAAIALGVVIQIIATVKKKRLVIGPMFIAAGIVFAIISIIVTLPMR